MPDWIRGDVLDVRAAVNNYIYGRNRKTRVRHVNHDKVGKFLTFTDVRPRPV
jgi:hypothetical protein